MTLSLKNFLKFGLFFEMRPKMKVIFSQNTSNHLKLSHVIEKSSYEFEI